MSGGPSRKLENAGEGWLTSYADLLSLLLSFFIVLYSFSTPDQQKLNQVNQSIAQAFQNAKAADMADTEPTDTERQLQVLRFLMASLNLGGSYTEAVEKIAAISDHDEEAKSAITEKLENFSASHSLDQDIATAEMVFPWTEGGRGLSPTLAAAAKELAGILTEMPRILEIEVVSHIAVPADAKRAFAAQMAVSAQRATTFAAALVDAGVAEALIRASGRSFYSPLNGNGKSVVNNRIEVRVRSRLR